MPRHHKVYASTHSSKGWLTKGLTRCGATSLLALFASWRFLPPDLSRSRRIWTSIRPQPGSIRNCNESPGTHSTTAWPLRKTFAAFFPSSSMPFPSTFSMLPS